MLWYIRRLHYIASPVVVNSLWLNMNMTRCWPAILRVPSFVQIPAICMVGIRNVLHMPITFTHKRKIILNIRKVHLIRGGLFLSCFSHFQCFVQLLMSNRCINYRCTLAPFPPIRASTSSHDAIVVSPGVVIARAPWQIP